MTIALYKTFISVGIDEKLAAEAAASIPENPATKADIAEVRVEIAEVRVEVANLRADIKEENAELRCEMVAIEERVTRRLMIASITASGLIISANAAIISLL